VVLDTDLMRLRRRALALSQSDLARGARIGERTVRTAEQGKHVSPDTAMQLAVALGTPYIVLVRKGPEEIQARLMERGYAVLEPPEPWLEREETETLVETLQGAPHGAVVCLEGQSGIGKSVLARRVAMEVAERFPDGSIWVNAANLGDDARVRRLQLDLARCLGFAELLPEPDLVPTEAFDRSFACRLWLRRRLLVMDDVKDAEDVQRLLDPERPSWVIVTTSHRYVAERVSGEHFRLRRWDEDTTRRLLAAMLGEDRLDADPEGARELARLTGGVPLAVRAMADALKRRRYTTPSAYVQGVSQGGVEGLGREDHARVGALYVFQDQPFSMAFAREATGLSEVATRLLIEQLSDLYLVREAPVAEPDEVPQPRFQLNSGSRGMAFWNSAEAERAMDRLLRAAPDLAVETTKGQATLRTAMLLDIDLPVWRVVLDEAARRVLGEGLVAAEAPDEVPEVVPGAELELLPHLLRNLSALLLFRPPPETGRWLTAGLAAARAHGHDTAIRDLTGLMMMWWWLGRQRFGAGSRWASAATKIAVATGPPQWSVAFLVFAASLVRFADGTAPARVLLEQAVDLSRDPGVSGTERACALGTLGALLLYEPDYQRAEDLFTEALDALRPEAYRQTPVIRAEITMNLAVVRFILHRELPPAADLRASVDEILKVFKGSTLLEAQVMSLARTLGVDGPWQPQSAAQAFFAVPPELMMSRLLRLSQTAMDLGQPIPGMGYEGAIHTERGDLSMVTTPLVPRDGHPPLAMYLVVPLSPIRRMLSGNGLDIALEFFEAARGADDPNYTALAALRGSL
jgi:transcriptional regulator with XRE-family HTH domain